MFEVEDEKPTDLAEVMRFWSILNAPQAQVMTPASARPFENDEPESDLAVALSPIEGKVKAKQQGIGKEKEVVAEEITRLRSPQQCLVCGQEKPVLDRLQGNLKQVPGGQSSGTALLSANKEAFESYGMKASLVSPICSECGAEAVRGLNLLLTTDTEKHRYDLGGVAFLFWLGKDAKGSNSDWLLPLIKQWFAQPQPETLQVLQSIVGSSNPNPDPDPNKPEHEHDEVAVTAAGLGLITRASEPSGLTSAGSSPIASPTSCARSRASPARRTTTILARRSTSGASRISAG